MKKQSQVLSIVAGLFALLSVFGSCKKINEATELGGNLIPPVDNINTFDTTLEVQTINKLLNDSTRSNKAYTNFLGLINNDPLFGKTEASIYLELKPAFDRIDSANDRVYKLPFAKDSLIALDSVVLVLDYTGVYGDSTQPLQVNVHEIQNNVTFSSDTNYLISATPFALGQALAPTKTFLPKDLNDSIFPVGQRTANQLRIKLDPSFGSRMLNYDTTNAYKSNNEFEKYFKGFAIVPQQNGASNALVAFDISAESATRLTFYYRAKNGAKADTTSFNFIVSGRAASANFIKRDYSGAQIQNAIGDNNPDELIYIQNTPGSFAEINIPGLNNLSNRVVHRAELIVEQVFDPSDKTFAPPQYLFLDAYDTDSSFYRTIPFDFSFDQNGQFNANEFGMTGMLSSNSGNSIRIWKFNLTRYIQHVANKTEKVYPLRLSSPFFTTEIYRNGAINRRIPFFINPVYAAGRVRVGGGNHPTQKMRLRIVYSKI